MEHILPISANHTPTYHNNSIVIRCNKEYRDIMADIGNTILTIWPRYLEIALGKLGKYMPLEMHICIPREAYNRYNHASTSLIDFKDKGTHRYITYPGTFYEHRKISTRNLKIIMETFPGPTADIAGKASTIVELLRAGNRAVKARVVALAGEGVRITQGEEEEVSNQKHLNIKNKINNKQSKHNKYITEIICKTLKYRYLGKPDGNKRIKTNHRRRRCQIEQKEIDLNINTSYMLKYKYTIIFFRYKMEKHNLLYIAPRRKEKENFPVLQPQLNIEINIAKEHIKALQAWSKNMTEEDDTRENNEIKRKYIMREGSNAPEKPP